MTRRSHGRACSSAAATRRRGSLKTSCAQTLRSSKHAAARTRSRVSPAVTNGRTSFVTQRGNGWLDSNDRSTFRVPFLATATENGNVERGTRNEERSGDLQHPPRRHVHRALERLPFRILPLR